MLDKVLPTQPISGFRTSGGEILEEIQTSPVLLTQHGSGAGILMSIELYNNMVSYIRSFERIELMQRRLSEMEDESLTVVSFEYFCQQLKERDLLNE